MMNERKDHLEVEQAKINLETARMPWKDLQRFFAAGQVFEVDESLDLTKVAMNMSQDNATYIQKLISSNKIGRVLDVRALRWFETDALVWCVVVKPYVLVQSVEG